MEAWRSIWERQRFGGCCRLRKHCQMLCKPILWHEVALNPRNQSIFLHSIAIRYPEQMLSHSRRRGRQEDLLNLQAIVDLLDVKHGIE